ncbi:MAG: carbohydrate kinase [Muribaculaceae bacterium]|nr:carbohydrate kinase [Muribaculaceae bacterium]
MDKKIIVGIGEVLWDCLPGGRKLGGAPANFAYHASQCGFDGCVVSAVGEDELGAEALSIFADKGLNFEIAEVPFPTGTVLITLDETGVPNYEFATPAAWDNIPFTPAFKELAESCRAVCFGSLAQRCAVSRGSIRRFVLAVPDDSMKIFDVNLRQNFYDRELLDESMTLCNVLKINDEELETIRELFNLPEGDVKSQCRALIWSYELKMLILTCGVKGSYVFTPDEESFLPTPEVEVADTVGAGDSFTASFVASILQGKSIPESHSIATRTAAYVCTHHGAMPPYPD